jgi:hypothetical protein
VERKQGVWCSLGSKSEKRMITTFNDKVGENTMLYPDCNVTEHRKSPNASYECNISVPKKQIPFCAIYLSAVLSYLIFHYLLFPLI